MSNPRLFVKSFSFLLMLFMLSNVSIAQKVNEENLTEKVKLYWDSKEKHISAKGAYYTDNTLGDTQEKHGKWKFYDFNGTLEEERNYFRDRIHGKQIKYYEDKSIQTETFFVFNVADSSFKEWNESGTLITQGNYDLGSPDGEWNYYYSDGQLKKREWISNDTLYLIELFDKDSAHTQIIKDGNGVIEQYYSSGRLKEFYTYKNGLKTGNFEERLANGIITIRGQFLNGLKHHKWQYYAPNGQLEEAISFHLDTLHGEYTSYFPDQSIKSKGTYLKGRKHEQWTWMMETGNVEMEGGFVEGKQDGKWQYYFSSGEPSYVAHFTKGKRTGDWIYYFIDGSTFKSGSYKKDLKTSKWITNYENGKTLMSGEYINGLEHGQWINYWENGTMKNSAYFKSGELNGEWKSFSPEHTLLIDGEYKNGLKSGEWRSYNGSGKLLLLENFKVIKSKQKPSEIIVIGRNQPISVLHGKFEAYSEVDFTLKASGVYKKGKKNGTFIDYYPGGVIPTIVAQYKNGRLNGLFQQFTRRGAIRHQIQYKDGLKDGSFLIFNSSGKVIVRKEFLKGIEINN